MKFCKLHCRSDLPDLHTTTFIFLFEKVLERGSGETFSLKNVSSMKFSGKTFSRNGGTPFLRFPEPLSKSFKLGKTTK